MQIQNFAAYNTLEYALRVKSFLLMLMYVMLPYMVLFSATIYGGEQTYDSTKY